MAELSAVAQILAHRAYRSLFWGRPALHRPYLRIRHLPATFHGTRIVVQGFPRSGNTFLQVVLAECGEEPIEVFAHMHSPTVFRYALDQEIPVIMPVRAPLQSVASLIVWNKWHPIRAIDHYLSYYRNARRYLNDIAVAEFANFTRDTPTFLRRVEAITGIVYRRDDHETLTEYGFRRIDERRADESGSLNVRFVNRPGSRAQGRKRPDLRPTAVQIRGGARSSAAALFALQREVHRRGTLRPADEQPARHGKRFRRGEERVANR